jgi:phospholipase/carboxylesterase
MRVSIDKSENLPSIDGPSRDPKSGTVKSLVILCHGLGADGNDLIPLADEWRDALPDTAFISPDAPFECDMAPMGRQWFSMRDHDPDRITGEIKRASDILIGFIRDQLDKYEIDGESLALVGFSQGAMTCLYTGLRLAGGCRGIIGYSGALHGADQLESDIISKPPILLCHGDSDPVVPVTATMQASQRLQEMGLPVETEIYDGLGHGINPDGLNRGKAFLKRILYDEAIE